MIEVSMRVKVGKDAYHRNDVLEAEPMAGDGISFGGVDDNLVLQVRHRLHLIQPATAADLALDVAVLSHYGDDPAFALLAHGFTKDES